MDWQELGGIRAIPQKNTLKNNYKQFETTWHWWSCALTHSISLAQQCRTKCRHQNFRRNAVPPRGGLVPTQWYSQNGTQSWGYGDLAVPWSESLAQNMQRCFEMFWGDLDMFGKTFFLGQKRQNFCCIWNVACMSSPEPRQNQMVHPDHLGMNVGRSTMPKNGTGPNEGSPVNRWRRRRRNRPGNHSGLMKTCDPNLQNDPNGLIFLKQRWKGLKLIALNKFDLNIFEPNFAHVQH